MRKEQEKKISNLPYNTIKKNILNDLVKLNKKNLFSYVDFTRSPLTKKCIFVNRNRALEAYTYQLHIFPISQLQNNFLTYVVTTLS